MESLGIATRCRSYLKYLGLVQCSVISIPVYVPLSLELLCSFRSSPTKAQCRLGGIERELDFQAMRKALGFHAKGLSAIPSTWNPAAAWFDLTGFDNWDVKNLSSQFLKDPALIVVHKFLSFNISGKYEGNKLNTAELFLLWAAHSRRNVNLSPFLWNTYKSLFQRKEPRATSLLFVSLLAQEFGVLQLANPPDTDREYTCASIGIPELKGAKLLRGDNEFVPHHERKRVQDYLLSLAAREHGFTASASSSRRGKRPIRSHSPACDDATEAEPATSPSHAASTHDSASLLELRELRTDIQGFHDTTLSALRDLHQEVGDLREQLSENGAQVLRLQQRLDAWISTQPHQPPADP